MQADGRSDRQPPGAAAWPALDYAAWQDSCTTLQLWLQIVGKIRMAQMPAVNHWWHVPLYLTARGLTTSPMPCGDRSFQIDFDFIDHLLSIAVSDGRRETMALTARPVASFYREIMARLGALALPMPIWPVPVEIADPVPFADDDVHAAYDPVMVNRFWQALAQIDQVLKAFRAEFIGKASPVHFFWGACDLAVTRFSGRAAPPPPHNPMIPDSVNREAYSHEVSSAGFWPGNGGFGEAAFYSYAYPQPAGFAAAPVTTPGASYNEALGEFVLPYEAVRTAPSPSAALLDFLRQTYAAAADLGHWDRALERPVAAPAAGG